MNKITNFALVLISLALFSLVFSAAPVLAATTKTIYRYSPSLDQCVVAGSKEYKRLKRNRTYKTLELCSKKIKNKTAQVLGVKERQGGATTTVSLEIKER